MQYEAAWIKKKTTTPIHMLPIRDSLHEAEKVKRFKHIYYANGNPRESSGNYTYIRQNK